MMTKTTVNDLQNLHKEVFDALLTIVSTPDKKSEFGKMVELMSGNGDLNIELMINGQSFDFMELVKRYQASIEKLIPIIFLFVIG